MAKKKLNIFHSDFLMRANLKEKELVIQKRWKKLQLINLVQKNKNKKLIFHSGPPYANGNIHIGHALNKILKDFVLRYFSLNGFITEYRPGWDTHGLPIANAVTQKYPDIKFNQNPLEFRKLCAEYANEQVKNQIIQFERLGLLIDFSNPYLTSDSQYVSKQLEILAALIEKKLIFFALKPVLWSWSSQTALAETEIIYKNKTSNSAFVTFPLFSKKTNNFFHNTFLLVWTTAIWTLPENKLISINQNEEYIKFPFNNRYLIVAKKCLKYLSFLNIDLKLSESFKGTKLLLVKYVHPYLNFSGFLVHSNHVSMTEGTGIVHIAPAHGIEDYELAKKHNIDFEVSVDGKGYFNDKSTDKSLIGKFYQDAESFILDKMRNSNALIKLSKIQHSFPYDWRTDEPVFFCATPQWYLNLEKSKNKLSQNLKKIKWMPKWGERRMHLNLINRKDWCISRQRSWGVPLPLFFDYNQNPVLDSELIKTIATKIAKYGDQIWWKWDLSKLLSNEQIRKYQIQSKSQNTLDVWFDSGCSPQILFSSQKKQPFIDFIWEGNDQFRGWFNSLLTLFWSRYDHEYSFLGKILTHGFVNDEQGLKMSKSKGNTINPLDICQTLGADVIRIWAVGSDFYSDINLSENLINKFAQDYLKIRNTIRFLINNLMDFDYLSNFKTKLKNLDLILLFKFNNLLKELKFDFDQQEFHNGWIKLFQFINKDLSSSYFVFAKKILYEEIPDNSRRRQIQTVLYIVLKNLLILLAPFIPHTSEEAYDFLKKDEKKQSIHLESWPLSINYQFSAPLKEKIVFQSWIFNHLKKELSQLLQKEKIKKSEQFQAIIFISKNTKIFHSSLEWEKNCKKFYCVLPNFKKENNLLNNFVDFYSDPDLKNWLEVNQVLIHFEKSNLAKKHFFIKLKKISKK